MDIQSTRSGSGWKSILAWETKGDLKERVELFSKEEIYKTGSSRKFWQPCEKLTRHTFRSEVTLRSLLNSYAIQVFRDKYFPLWQIVKRGINQESSAMYGLPKEVIALLFHQIISQGFTHSLNYRNLIGLPSRFTPKSELYDFFVKRNVLIDKSSDHELTVIFYTAIPIYVKTKEGLLMFMDIEPLDSIENIKHKIKAQLPEDKKLDPSQQRLLLEGKQLSLSDIAPLITVCLFEKLRGEP